VRNPVRRLTVRAPELSRCGSRRCSTRFVAYLLLVLVGLDGLERSREATCARPAAIDSSRALCYKPAAFHEFREFIG
jgi:hypothetical protein